MCCRLGAVQCCTVCVVLPGSVLDMCCRLGVVQCCTVCVVLPWIVLAVLYCLCGSAMECIRHVL